MAYEHDPFTRAQADADTAALTRAGNRAARLRARGICLHGWVKAPAVGPAACLHCGKAFASTAALEAEQAELRDLYL